MVFVDKIVLGARPSHFSAEQLTKFELVIDLKTTKELGLTLSPLLPLCVDRKTE